MGTVSAGEIRTDEIKSHPGSGSITIGLAVFPVSDSAPRSMAMFGGGEESESFFARKSVYQSVFSSTATINAQTTVVGINFDGPVVLDLPSSSTGVNEISVVDEAGLCSATNTITATAPGAQGSLVLSSPYSYLSIKATSNSGFIAEVREYLLTPS